MTPSQPFRLGRGGLIDRTRTLSFTFDGQGFDGHPGDTLASALLANGVRLVGRSFKYHRPRGILTAGPEEPNALVELRGGARREPNTRATTAELFDGLVASSQNRWPSLRHDIRALHGLAGPLLGAGFYYKTFKWPGRLWERLYEPVIRRAAGLGEAPEEPDPDRYERANAHCEVLVVGAGPAGLAAALAAGRTGARVILCESEAILGGRLLSDGGDIDGRPAIEWVRGAATELLGLANVRIMHRTTVFGAYDHGTFGAIERVNDHVVVPPAHQPRQRYWRIVAARSVVAAGAIERPIAFPSNDRPGVMLASAVRTYVRRFAVAPGRHVAVFTTNDDGWRTVAALADAGVAVAGVIDARGVIAPAHTALAERAGARVFAGVVTGVDGARGMRAVAVARHDGGTQLIEADCLAVSGGWNPNIALATHLGGRPRWDEACAAFLPPDQLPPGMTVCGAAAGAISLAACLAGGSAAGRAAAGASGRASGAQGKAPVAGEEPAPAPSASLWRVDLPGKAFVDFQNDVTVKDIELAHREGYASVELAKRYTTLGMATDQGKTSNVVGLAILSVLAGRSIPETGTTTFRPPVEPVAIGAIAGGHMGRHLKPTRLPSTHDWAAENGASFIESGLWLRAQCYTRPGETSWLESCNREVAAVRKSVGVCDVSTLGKIDIQGPDAGAFLDLVYTNTFSRLAVGRARYGLMLREDGFVMDDGTTSRLGEHHYLMTTTTANAGRVMQHLEFVRQVLCPGLDVQLSSVSDQWAQLSVAGPHALDVLERVVDGRHDISSKGLPPLGVAIVTVLGGVPARLFRISYSGERAYEIAVPASKGDALIRALMERGRTWGITPYGLEALNVLRIEKGHVAGNEINGTTTARDLGLERLVSGRKDFIGRAMALRPGLLEPDRWRIAGFKPYDRNASLKAGAHFVPLDANPSAAVDQGYMTSVCHSPTLGHAIGLGLIARGHERHGEYVRAWDPVRGGDVAVEICDPVFVDPAGTRMAG